jgi:hypothetical protein
MNTATHIVKFRVTDVGDPVVGATVVWHGHVGHTNGSGFVAVVVPKGTAPGAYPVVASAANYTSAQAVLTVVR